MTVRTFSKIIRHYTAFNYNVLVHQSFTVHGVQNEDTEL